MPRVTLLVSTLASLCVAGTAQAQSAASFSGKYDLACKGASIGATLDLAGGVGLQDSGHRQVSVSLKLSCNENDPALLAELERVAAEVEAKCESILGDAYDRCEEAGQSVAQALYDVNAGLIAQLPTYASLYVGETSNWWNQLIGLYPYSGSVSDAQGHTSEVGGLINSSGQFGAVGLQIFGGDGVGNDEAGLGCVAWAAGGVDGRVFSSSNKLKLNAKYNINGNLTCGGAHNSAAWFLVNIGLNLQSEVEGPKR